jgi:hypothetical protein
MSAQQAIVHVIMTWRSKHYESAFSPESSFLSSQQQGENTN